MVRETICAGALLLTALQAPSHTTFGASPSPATAGSTYTVAACGLNKNNDIWFTDAGPTTSATHFIDKSNVVDTCFTENFVAQDPGTHTLNLYEKGSVGSKTPNPKLLATTTLDVQP